MNINTIVTDIETDVQSVLKSGESALLEAFLPGASTNLPEAVEKKVTSLLLANPALSQSEVEAEVNAEITTILGLIAPHVPSILLSLVSPIVSKVVDGAIASAYAAASKVASETIAAPVATAKVETAPVTTEASESAPDAPSTDTPFISGVDPQSGGAGTVITVTGSGLTGIVAVKVAGVDAAGFQIVGDTQITVEAPSGFGSGPVTVTNAAGQSALSVDNYTLGG